jgi:hypothetical protein
LAIAARVKLSVPLPPLVTVNLSSCAVAPAEVATSAGSPQATLTSSSSSTFRVTAFDSMLVSSPLGSS